MKPWFSLEMYYLTQKRYVVILYGKYLVAMKLTVFWDIAPRNLVEFYPRFRVLATSIIKANYSIEIKQHI
jgi:hypothetical protein